MSLHLFTACRPWLVALPAASVIRLLLPEEARLRADLRSKDAPPAALGVLETGGDLWPALDLGRLLGLSEQTSAFVLLELGEARNRMALRTGPCASVAPLEPGRLRPVPKGLPRDRPGGLRASFPLTAGPRLAATESLAEAGLLVDLSRLLTDEERAWAQATERAAREDTAGADA